LAQALVVANDHRPAGETSRTFRPTTPEGSSGSTETRRLAEMREAMTKPR
jgi:hypothetical protein